MATSYLSRRLERDDYRNAANTRRDLSYFDVEGLDTQVLERWKEIDRVRKKGLRAGLRWLPISSLLGRRSLSASSHFLNLNLSKNNNNNNFNSCITFFQQVGFASLESGSVRAKNTRNVLLKVQRNERVGFPK